MSTDEREGNRQEFRRLLEERDALQSQAADLRRQLREQSANEFLDEGDRATRDSLEALQVIRVNHLTRLLSQIERAISREVGGGSSRCVVCGEEIPVLRIKALPFTKTCVRCQMTLEEEGR